jgi:broad specificity phosphatase PhoE
MTIYFTRHGETKNNRDGRMQGPTTRGFTRQGTRQLRQLKTVLSSIQFDAIFSSDMPRCVDSAQYLASKENIVTYLPLLREKNNGSFAEQKITSRDWERLSGTFETRRAPGGENLLEVLERAKRFWGFIRQHGGENLLVVSHGAFLKVLFGYLLGKDVKESIFELTVDHCSLTIVAQSARGATRFITLNDTSHLA